MANKEIFNRRIQALCKELSKDYGFQLYKRTFLVRVQNDIVSMIVFDFPPGGMQLHIASQSLYIPIDILHLTFGYQVFPTNIKIYSNWGMYAENFDDYLAEIREKVQTVALPFLEQVSTAEGIVTFLNQKPPRGFQFPPSHRYSYLAYTNIQMKNYETAALSLRKAIAELSVYNIDYIKDEVATLQNLLVLILNKEYQRVDEHLEKTIAKVSHTVGLVTK